MGFINETCRYGRVKERSLTEYVCTHCLGLVTLFFLSNDLTKTRRTNRNHSFVSFLFDERLKPLVR